MKSESAIGRRSKADIDGVLIGLFLGGVLSIRNLLILNTTWWALRASNSRPSACEAAISGRGYSFYWGLRASWRLA